MSFHGAIPAKNVTSALEALTREVRRVEGCGLHPPPFALYPRIVVA
jgi:hypothetical protein